MYKIFAILGILTITLPMVNAQNQTGIYKSAGTPISCFENFALVILESSSKPQPRTPTTIISQDQEVRKFISDFCNFYYERTGTWFRLTGEDFNQTVMKEFLTTTPLPESLKTYVKDTQQTNETKP